MKYFTKEWYDLMQRLDYCLCMKAIPDKEYTDADIAALYDNALKKYVRAMRRDHNTPPSRIAFDWDEFDEEDFVMFDPESGKFLRPMSIDEVKQNAENEYQKALYEFEHRLPFDAEECEREFRHIYECRCVNELTNYPKWVCDSVDKRIAALGLLPKSVYDKLKIECAQNKKEFNKIERRARKVLSEHAKKIPGTIGDEFVFHDADILALYVSGENFVMELKSDGVCFEDELPYTRIIFVNAEVIEMDELLFPDTGKMYFINDNGCRNYNNYLYEELYRIDKGYEVHMLTTSGATDNGLAYITVRCTNIEFEHYD